MRAPNVFLGEVVTFDSAMGRVLTGIYGRMSDYASEPSFSELVRRRCGGLQCAAAWNLAVRDGARLVISATNYPLGSTQTGPIGIGCESRFHLDLSDMEIKLHRRGERAQYGSGRGGLYYLRSEGDGASLLIDSVSEGRYTEEELFAVAGVRSVSDLRHKVIGGMRRKSPVYHSANAKFRPTIFNGYGYVGVGSTTTCADGRVETLQTMELGYHASDQHGFSIQAQTNEQGGLSVRFGMPHDFGPSPSWPDRIAGPTESYGNWLLGLCGACIENPGMADMLMSS